MFTPARDRNVRKSCPKLQHQAQVLPYQDVWIHISGAARQSLSLSDDDSNRELPDDDPSTSAYST